MDSFTFCEFLVLGVIFLGGIVCNVLVIRATYRIRSKKMSLPSNNHTDCINLMIMNLAVADLLVLLVSIPTDVVADRVSWPFGDFVCKFISPIQDICTAASMLTFAVIAVERYLITKGTSQPCLRNGKRVVFGIWFASWLTIGVPLAIHKKIITDEDVKKCDVVWPNIYMGRFFLFYVLALVIGCAVTGAVSYCRIRQNLTKIQKLYTSDRSNVINEKESMDSFVEQSLKVSKMFSVLIALFVICTFPLLLFAVLLEFDVLNDYKYTYVTYVGTTCLFYSNSLANPATVLLMSRECRVALTWKRVTPRKMVCERLVLGQL